MDEKAILHQKPSVEYLYERRQCTSLKKVVT